MDTLDLSQLEELPITGDSSSFSLNWKFILISGGVFILGIILFYAYKYFTNQNKEEIKDEGYINYETNPEQQNESTPIDNLDHGENDPNNVNYCVGDKCYM